MGPRAPVFRLSKSENLPSHGLHLKKKCIHAPIRILTQDPSAVAADLRQLVYCLATHSPLFPITASADKEDPC